MKEFQYKLSSQNQVLRWLSLIFPRTEQKTEYKTHPALSLAPSSIIFSQVRSNSGAIATWSPADPLDKSALAGAYLPTRDDIIHLQLSDI